METEPSAPEPDLYLIAHRVRGKPAFDIAHKLQIGDEEGWIVPTSGHRAYPFWTFPLDSLFSYVPADDFMYLPGVMPNDLPDHYTTTAAPGKGLITGLTALLGIKRPTVEIKRRV